MIATYLQTPTEQETCHIFMIIQRRRFHVLCGQWYITTSTASRCVIIIFLSWSTNVSERYFRIIAPTFLYSIMVVVLCFIQVVYKTISFSKILYFRQIINSSCDSVIVHCLLTTQLTPLSFITHDKVMIQHCNLLFFSKVHKLRNVGIFSYYIKIAHTNFLWLFFIIPFHF